MAVLGPDEIGSEDLDSVGGKGASLGEMTGAGLPVPPCFVVTAGTYREFIERTGIDTKKREWGVMIETPASALGDEDLCQTGIDFASFGTNDLTRYTLAVDRNDENVAGQFDELHPAVLKLIGNVIETCGEYGVNTSICGEAGSEPKMVRFLVDEGVTSISANVDAVCDVKHEVKRVEQKLILDTVW